MKKMLILPLCIAMVFSMAACGKQATTDNGQNAAGPSSADSSQVSLSSGTSGGSQGSASGETANSGSLSSGEESTQQSNTSASNNQTGSSTQSAASALPKNMEDMAAGMTNVFYALALSADSGTYSSSDKSYFWTACAQLLSFDALNSAAAEEDSGKVTIPASYVKEFANALFAGYNGNTQKLPALPTSVSSSYQITYDSTDKEYTVPDNSGNQKDSIKLLSGKKITSGKYEVTFRLLDSDKKTIGDYRVRFEKTSYKMTGHPLYDYMVYSFAEIK